MNKQSTKILKFIANSDNKVKIMKCGDEYIVVRENPDKIMEFNTASIVDYLINLPVTIAK